MPWLLTACSRRAGFKMCMIHGGHGNLISQFASPLTTGVRMSTGLPGKQGTLAIEVLDRVRNFAVKTL